MKTFGLLVLVFVLSVFLGLLGTKVILSVSTLFGLTFLAGLGFVKLYGLLSIAQLVLYKSKDSQEDGTKEEKVKKVFNDVCTKALIYLIFWGFSFLMYNILT